MWNCISSNWLQDWEHKAYILLLRVHNCRCQYHLLEVLLLVRWHVVFLTWKSTSNFYHINHLIIFKIKWQIFHTWDCGCCVAVSKVNRTVEYIICTSTEEFITFKSEFTLTQRTYNQNISDWHFYQILSIKICNLWILFVSFYITNNESFNLYTASWS